MDLSELFSFENGIVLLGLIYSICLHEAGHAYVSDWLGDDTPRRLGKVTLNPVRHIETAPLFTLVLPIVSFLLSGGQGIIGGGACPVNPYKLRNPRRDEFLVAAAGPAMNLLLCIVFTAMLPLTGSSVSSRICLWLALNNLVVAVFNLLPIPPLDGSIMLRSIFPQLRPLFHSIGLGQGLLLAYLLGSVLMNRLMDPILLGYVGLMKSLGVFAGAR